MWAVEKLTVPFSSVALQSTVICRTFERMVHCLSLHETTDVKIPPATGRSSTRACLPEHKVDELRLTLQNHDLDVTSESQKHIGVTSGLPSSSNLRRQTWLGEVLGGFPGRRLRRIAWDSKDFQSRIWWQSRPGGRRRLDEVCQARTRRFSFFGRMWQVRPGFSKAVLLGRPGGFLGLSAKGSHLVKSPLEALQMDPILRGQKISQIPLFLCTKYVTCHVCRGCVL